MLVLDPRDLTVQNIRNTSQMNESPANLGFIARVLDARAKRGVVGASWNTSKWVCDANQASFCFAFTGFNVTVSLQHSRK